MPKVSPSTFSADLTSLLDESCLPGSTADLEIEVTAYVHCTLHDCATATLSQTSDIFIETLISLLSGAKLNVRIQ